MARRGGPFPHAVYANLAPGNPRGAFLSPRKNEPSTVIILLDLNLPDMSGFEVLRRLRVSKVKTPILIAVPGRRSARRPTGGAVLVMDRLQLRVHVGRTVDCAPLRVLAS